MQAQEFGQLIEAERLRRGWTRSKLAVAVGILDDGSALDATQVRRIIEGTRKLDPEVVERLTAALHLDPSEAFAAAQVLPHGFKADHFRKLGFFASQPSVVSRGQRALRVPADLAKLIDRNRRLELVAA
jgi:transcriptional regulator with XRE-family HTH domain